MNGNRVNQLILYMCLSIFNSWQHILNKTMLHISRYRFICKFISTDRGRNPTEIIWGETTFQSDVSFHGYIVWQIICEYFEKTLKNNLFSFLLELFVLQKPVKSFDLIKTIFFWALIVMVHSRGTYISSVMIWTVYMVLK